MPLNANMPSAMSPRAHDAQGNHHPRHPQEFQPKIVLYRSEICTRGFSMPLSANMPSAMTLCALGAQGNHHPRHPQDFQPKIVYVGSNRVRMDFRRKLLYSCKNDTSSWSTQYYENDILYMKN